MEKLDFTIAPDAAEYLRRMFEAAGKKDEVVLTIAPMSAERKTLDPSAIEDLTDEKIKRHAENFLKSLSIPVNLEWSIGGINKSRLRAEEILSVNGIECFFPPEVRAIVNGRALLLRDGQLVFEPQLDPPSSALPRRLA